MTVLGKGDPAYAAYYDNVRNVLGFYDDLNGIGSGPLTYVVVGWYSKREDDPLYEPKTKQEWLDKLDFMGWGLGTDDEEAARLVALEERTLGDREDVGLISVRDRDQFTVIDPTTGLTAPSPESAISSIASQLDVRLSSSYLFGRYWPRQLLCHGTVYDVPWGGSGGTFDSPDAGPPSEGSVKVAVGNTGGEAISALIADRRNQPNLERVLSAFHHGLLAQIQQPDGLGVLESFLHAEDFQSKPGGFYEDQIEQGDIFPDQSPTDKGKIKALIGRLYEAHSQITLDRDQGVKAPPATKSVGSQDKLRLAPETGGSYQGLRQQGPGQSVLRTYIPATFGQTSDKALAELNEEVRQRDETPANQQTAGNRRRLETVRRALPRFWEPRDPVVLLSETRRSFAHGEDGRLTDDETLACRLTGETVASVNIVMGKDRSGSLPARLSVGPYDLVQTVLPSGRIPPEAIDVYQEAVLLDLTSARVGANTVMERIGKGELDVIAPVDRYDRGPTDPETIAEKLQVEGSLLWNPYRDPEIGAQGVASISGVEGTAPVPFSIRPWMKPWTPLHLDWEVEFIPSPNLQRDWILDEHDFVPREGLEDAILEEEGTSCLYKGRTLLTPATSRVLANQLEKFIEQESSQVGLLADRVQEIPLGNIRQALRNIDVLATSLGGFHEMLLGLESEHAFFGVDDPIPTIDEPLAQNPDLPLFPVRAGHLKLRRLRIVDSFGQFHDVAPENLTTPARAEDMRTPVDTARTAVAPHVPDALGGVG
jgi:hypothetical protein